MKTKALQPVGIFILLISLTMVSCNSEKAPAEETVKTSGTVKLTREQMDLAGFAFGQVEKHLLSGDVSARGMLILPPEEEAMIGPVMGGVVSRIEVMQGQKISKGELLCRLTHPDFVTMQQDYVQAVNRLEYLKNDYERQKKLYDEGVSSEKRYLQAKTDYRSTKAMVNAHELILKQLGMDPKEILNDKIYPDIPVVSPMEGMVDEILTNLGQHVSSGDPLFRVVCRKRLLVELNVFEKDIMKVKPGQRVSFRLSNVDAHDEYQAEIITTGGSVQQAGRVVKVLAEFHNSGQLLMPGMFVAATLHTGEESFDALPESAIMNYGSDDTYVYYTLSPEDADSFTFEQIPVQTGYAEDGYIRVKLLDKLPQDARIVTTGGYYVKAQAANTGD